MTRTLSGEEFHALYCPIKNRKSAFFLVVSFSWLVFVSWKDLYKPPEQPDWLTLIFTTVTAVLLLAAYAGTFTCLRERLVLGLFIVNSLAGQILRFKPSVFGLDAANVISGSLALWLLCLFISMSMFVQAMRSPSIEASTADASAVSPLKGNLLILAVVTLIAMVLGSLLYFLPLRQ